jgi:spermidine/putrescine transport system ATP-binding protein
MSDRVAVMSNGKIEQVGTPATVYEDPGTVFVADFLGVSNLMDAEAGADPGSPDQCAVTIGDFTLRAACGDTSARGAVKVVARPERIQLLAHGSERDNCLPGMVERTVYVGATLQVMVRLVTGAQLQASVTNTGSADGFDSGAPVSVHVPADALRVLGAEAPPEVDPEAAAPDEDAAAAEPSQAAGKP